MKFSNLDLDDYYDYRLIFLLQKKADYKKGVN